MSLINWIFDIYQHTRISDLARENERLRAIRVNEGATDLAPTVGQLCLAVKALKQVLVEKGIVTDAELMRLVERIDAEDGKRDGQAPTA
jgi:hypothetical protein